MTEELSSRSQMRRIATTHPDVLIQEIERLRAENKSLLYQLDMGRDDVAKGAALARLYAGSISRI